MEKGDNAGLLPFCGRSPGARSKVLASLVLLVVLSVQWRAFADAPSWQFAPRRAGSVLIEGGWMVDLPLGEIHASPEFRFPLQLIYHNARTDQGGFGAQWFCPQLESRVLPREQGLLVWTMPSGGMIGLFAAENRANKYSDRGGGVHSQNQRRAHHHLQS